MTMDFELSNEMKNARRYGIQVAVQEVEPVAKEADEKEKYTLRFARKAGANGLIGCWIPEEIWRKRRWFSRNTIITEQIARVCMGIGLNITAATFGAENIHYYGTREQKEKYLPPVCAGDAYLQAPIRNRMRARMWQVTRQGPFRMAMTM